MELIKIYDQITNIIGEGNFKYTEIHIHKNLIEILTDEFVTAEKIAKIDKIMGKEGHITPRDGTKFAIQYYFPRND